MTRSQADREQATATSNGTEPPKADGRRYVMLAGKVVDTQEGCWEGPCAPGEGGSCFDCGPKTGAAIDLTLVVGVVTFGLYMLINAVSKSPRLTNLEDFPNISDEDKVETSTQSRSGVPMFTVTLRAQPGMWMKSAQFVWGKGNEFAFPAVSTKGTRTEQRFSVPAEFLTSAERPTIVLGKAKWWGVLTQMYQIPVRQLRDSAGDHADITFTWLKD